MKKIIAFDLDDVLCYREKKYDSLGANKYNYCKPIHQNIELMNECYDNGFYIKIYTARGMTHFAGDYPNIISSLYDLTHNQLIGWNAKFHELIFGKIHYDILIDDKVRNIDEIDSLETIKKYLNEI